MFWQHFKWVTYWSIFILVLCGLPGSSFPRLAFLDWLRPDKIVHLFLFGVESFLLITAFDQQTLSNKLRRRARFQGVLIAILYGILVEVLQNTIFIGRSGDYRDAIANAIGAFIGLWIFNRFEKKNLKVNK